MEQRSRLHQVVEGQLSGLNSDALNFLTSSGGVGRIIDRVSRTDCGIDEAVTLVQGEPLIAAKMVAVANSAAYSRSGRSVTSIRDALSLLGLGLLKTMATAAAVRRLADQAARTEPGEVSKLWAHSIEVGAIASILSRRFTQEDPGTALFAGIIHEIAGFFLMSRSAEIAKFTGERVIDAIRRDEKSHDEQAHSVTAMVARRLHAALRVPEHVADAIEGQWRGYMVLPPETLADCLLVANLLATARSPFDPDSAGPRSGNIDMNSVLEQKELMNLFREAKTEIHSIEKAFDFSLA